MAELTELQIPIGSVSPYPGNPRIGDVDAIATSLERNGQYRPIVVQQSTGFILAGNHTWKAAKKLGWDTVAATFVDVDDQHARRIVLVDNRSNDLASYEDYALTELLQAVAADDDWTGTGYTEEDLDALMSVVEDDAVPPDLGTPPELPEPISVVGDIWEVGGHRIACGDSSDFAVLDAVLAGVKVGVLLTDPPYGINLETDYSNKNGGYGGMTGREYRKVIGDDRPFDAGAYAHYFDKVAEQFWFGADYYRRTLPAADLSGSWLVWDKRDEDPDDPDSNWDDALGSSFELAWSRQKHKRAILRYRWTNWTSHVNAGHRREHPTEKPIEMLAEILTRWTPKGAAVADPFAGSGSTLIAAAATGRTGYGVELDPLYVDVIVARLEKATGDVPRNLTDGTTRSFLARS